MESNYSSCPQTLILVAKSGKLFKTVLGLYLKIVVILFMLWTLMPHLLSMKIEYSFGEDGGKIIGLNSGFFNVFSRSSLFLYIFSSHAIIKT